jgi:predicted dehydrogenase
MAYHQQTRQAIATGKLGKVYHIKRGAFGWVRRNDWQALTKFGGGMLNNHGAHFMDQLLDLTGRDVAQVFCQLRRVAAMGDAEDVVKVVYRTKAGILGEVEINQAIPHGSYELEVFGTHGKLWKEQGNLKLRYFRPEELPPREMEVGLASANRQYPCDNAKFYDETIAIEDRHKLDVYADFARAIHTGSEPYVKPAETLAVMQMLERCRQEARHVIATPI